MKSSILPSVAVVLCCLTCWQFSAAKVARGDYKTVCDHIEHIIDVADNQLFKLMVDAGDIDRTEAVVTALVDTGEFKGDVVTLTDAEGNTMFGQLSVPSIDDVKSAGTQRELTFILPSLKRGQTLELTASDAGLNPHLVFAWHDDKYGTAELQYADQGVLKYMYEPLDNSSEQRRQETYKVYHHVFSPDGSRLITKGPGGLYPHHRGLFYGFNVIKYGDNKTADVWHCKEGACQTHEKSLRQIAGPVFGRDVNVINWRGTDGQPFARELREMTAFKVNGGTLIDFASTLVTVAGKISLAGDPQHAGFQFRASQDVPDKTKDQTYYIRPDGKAKPGEFRNWSANPDETDINKHHINLPWNAVCITLPIEKMTRGEKSTENRQFTICYFDQPGNPKPARFSERDYGRFGSYFEYNLTEDHPLHVRYRVWVQEGEMSVEQIQSLSDSFVYPVKVKVL